MVMFGNEGDAINIDGNATNTRDPFEFAEQLHHSWPATHHQSAVYECGEPR
jgi:hypothetical protein